MISPSFVYIFIWASVMWLQSLQMVVFYEPVNELFVYFQLVVFVTLLASELVIKEYSNLVRKNLYVNLSQLASLHLFNKRLFFLLVGIFIFESVVSGGFPLVWLAIGDGRTHVDFGIPTLHGAFHGFLLFFATSSFLLLKNNICRKKNLFHVGLFIVYAILVFNRGIVIIFLIQALFIYLVMKGGVRLSFLFYFFIFFAALVYVFGVLGDFRSGGNLFAVSVSGEWEDFFEVFPQSLLWFYVYVTGGLNNLYYNLPDVEPVYVPLYTFAKLVPTVVYDVLDMPKAYDSFILDDGRLTVSTAFQGLVSDFGLFGILGYLPILILAQISYRNARSGAVLFIMLYGMLMQTIVMTLYIDTVFYLTFLLQLLLVFYFMLRKSGRAPIVLPLVLK